MKQKFINFFEATGMLWVVPLIRLVTMEDPKTQVKEVSKLLGYPALAIIIFIAAWSYMSTQIKTSVGQLPSPSYVWSQAGAMWHTHKSEKVRENEFEKIELLRSQFNDLITQRTDLDKQNKDSEVLNEKIATLLESTQKSLEQYKPLIESHQKIVDNAIKIKNDEIDALKKTFTEQGYFKKGDDGKIELDEEGNKVFNEKAASQISSLSNYRVAVYESNLVNVYQSIESSYKSLIGKITKIEKYVAKGKELHELPDSEATTKKITINDKKRAAFEKQLSKKQEFQGNGTIIDYIKLSIITVLFGFMLAAIVAIPLGILCGLSPAVMTALNPLIQTFRPVSPLAWVLITIQIIDGIFVGENALEGDIIKNTFLHAGITVALCSLWATLSNTALGVSSVDQDHLNVAKVLKLNWFDRIFKIVLPSAVPYIFTGLRITLGVGWMVLIVSEMMATSRGLGWFIDQEYQNNKVESLANIIVCIFIIGLIGAVLDRVMFTLQKLVSFNDEVSA